MARLKPCPTKTWQWPHTLLKLWGLVQAMADPHRLKLATFGLQGL